MSGNTRYSVSPHFKIKCWSNQCVASHTATGVTHRLDKLSSIILNTLRKHSNQSLSDIFLKIKELDISGVSEHIVDTYIRQLILAGILEKSDAL